MLIGVWIDLIQIPLQRDERYQSADFCLQVESVLRHISNNTISNFSFTNYFEIDFEQYYNTNKHINTKRVA